MGASFDLARWNRRAVSRLIVVAWLVGAASNYLRISGGRPESVLVTDVAPVTGIAKVALYACLLATASMALVIIGRNAQVSGKVLSAKMLAVPMLPFIVLAISGLLSGVIWTKDTFIYPLVIFALWRARAPLQTLVVIGWLTIITAAGSVYLGLTNPAIGTIPVPITGEKVFWPTLLAGPYSHSNVLGLALSLGVPFILLIRRRSLLVIGVLVTEFALIWSGNRCSIGASLVVLVGYALMRGRPRNKVIPTLLAVVGAYLVVVIPITSQEPAAYSDRGAIWKASFVAWHQAPLLGHGIDYFSRIATYVNPFGLTAFNGHNAMVHALVTGGLLLLVTIATFVVALFRGAGAHAHDAPTRAVVLVFVIGLIYNSWLQNTVVYSGVSELAYAGWIAMAVVLFAPASRPDPREFGTNESARPISRSQQQGRSNGDGHAPEDLGGALGPPDIENLHTLVCRNNRRSRRR